MAFPVKARRCHWLFVCGLLYVCIFNHLPVILGQANAGATKGDPKEEHTPSQADATASSCFDDNYMYSGCEEPYRLDIQGSINVPRDYTDKFCYGPCLSETHKVLDCLEHSFPDFEFHNKATIKDVRATLKAACGDGTERGNFDVAGHIGTESEESNAAKANSIAFGIILFIILRRELF